MSLTDLRIYTDGACIGNGMRENIGGWCFVVVGKDGLLYEKCEVDFNTTNNRQEITAVLRCLQYCHENKISDFIVYCDSQYVVNGFNDWMHKWRAKQWVRGKPAMPIPNIDLWKEMYRTRFLFDKVNLKWVRGHNGNEWNEYADQLIEYKMANQHTGKCES